MWPEVASMFTGNAAANRIIALALPLALVGFMPIAHASPPPSHICLVGGSGISIDGKGTKDRSISIYYLEPGQSQRFAFSAYPDEAAKDVTGFIPKTGDGTYSAYGITVDTTGEDPTLTGVNGNTVSCRPAAFFSAPEDRFFDGLGSEFGVSMGSVIREKPDAGARKIGSFPQGRHITIAGKTDERYQDHIWLKVLLGKDEYGYIWGGTVCTPLFAVPGTAECPQNYGGTAATLVADTAKGIPGRSTLGTRVRAKPDTNAAVLASIPVGAPLRVTGETGSFYDTFQWVEVSYDGGRKGYAWGGSVCTEKTQITGVHFPC